jgi:hypothetical protein
LPEDSLPPDPDSVEKWRNLPQNKPTRQALPPMTGGLHQSRMLLIGLGVLLLAAVIISLLLGR